MSARPHTPRLAVLTPSYRNDYERARDLCASIDRFCDGAFEHLLVVPQRDLALFAPLRSERRRVLSEREVLAGCGLRELPLPTRLRLPLLGTRKFRQQWWCSGIGRVSGWLTQQLVKLATPALTAADLLLFIDSDVLLVRAFELARLLTPAGAVRLHRMPLGLDLNEHRGWYLTARRLLGVQAVGNPEYNYVGNLVAWRRSTLQALRERIETVNGESWHRAVLRAGAVSEYMLYGVFVNEVLADAVAHDSQPLGLTHSVWRPDQWQSAAALAAGMAPEGVALHLQSTLPVTDTARRALIGEVCRYLSACAVPPSAPRAVAAT